MPGRKRIVLRVDERNQLRRQVRRHHVIGDLAGGRIEDALEIVPLVPRREILPPQAEPAASGCGDTFHTSSMNGRNRRRGVVRPRIAERTGAVEQYPSRKSATGLPENCR